MHASLPHTEAVTHPRTPRGGVRKPASSVWHPIRVHVTTQGVQLEEETTAMAADTLESLASVTTGPSVRSMLNCYCTAETKLSDRAAQVQCFTCKAWQHHECAVAHQGQGTLPSADAEYACARCTGNAGEQPVAFA